MKLFFPRLPIVVAAGFTAFGACSALSAAPAWAGSDRPVIVEYVAPPECASNDAFTRLVEAEVARAPHSDRTWRFSVHIRGAPGSFEGTLTTETGGVRSVTARSCDDVTAAFAVIIAMADELQPEEPKGETPPLPPSVLIEPAPPPPALPSPSVLPSAPDSHPIAKPVDEDSHVQFRVGARGFVSTHGQDNTPGTGALGVASIELPWGFRKLQFEVGLGAMSTPNNSDAPTYTILDTQTCLLDIPIGDTHLSVLGCVRLAGAWFTDTYVGATPSSYPASTLASYTTYRESGGAFWTGIGGRIRWQSNLGFYAEANLDGVYGTVSSGEDINPLWFDAGVSVGWRLY